MKGLIEKIEAALKILKAAKYDFYEANLLLAKFCEIYDQELKILKESIEEADSNERVKELKIQIEKIEKVLKEILETFNRYSQSIEDFLNKIEEIKQRL
jgi:sugar-specific transcriptional regulator TrmB